MDIVIRECAFGEIDGIVEAALKSGVCVAPKKCPCRYWLAECDGRVVACAALAMATKRKARLFGAFTLSQYRGKGIWTRLYEVRIQAAVESGATIAESFLRPITLPMYLRRGYKVKRNYTATYHVVKEIGGRK